MHSPKQYEITLPKRWFVALAAGAMVALLLLSCGEEKDHSDNPSRQTPPAQSTAPRAIEFNATDLDGNLRSSTEWVGKQPVALNIWGTWCPPCRKEIPDLVRLYEEYQPLGIEIIGLAVRDTPQRVKQFAEQNGMEWVLLMGNQTSLIPLGKITGVPTTIFLDKDGREIGRFTGFQSYENFKRAFDMLVESSRS